MTSDPLTPLRVLDLALLVLALPVFLIAGLPLSGWVAAALIWAMWRGIGAWADRRAKASGDLRAVAGYEAGGMIARGWIMGISLLLFGLAAGSDAGLAAAVLVVALFTVAFTMKLILRAFDVPPPKDGRTA